MKAKKVINKSVGMTIAEYNRVTSILFPKTEPAQLTSAQRDSLALAEIDGAMVELAAERDRILLEQSKRELAFMTECQAYPVDYPDTAKIKTKKY
ncbi:MAG: hypothetical protein WCT07_04595 [Candidatus Paceibacterota bacterium]|jgi:hypothetical protein